MNQKKSWTVIDILKTTTDFFTKKDIENPRLNAERLLAHVLKTDRVQLYIQFERLLTEPETQQYRDFVQRRSSFEPLQYITGETDFMDLKFIVNPDVLIPRPETEILVENVLALKNAFGKRQVSILDIGTGSGCIAASLAHHWKNCNVTATDISENSLEVAKQNSLLNNVNNRIKFINHNILDAVSFPVSDVDIVVSNPPYISLREMETLSREVKDFEPLTALTDKNDGTLFYEKIITLLAGSNSCRFALLELSATQTDKILDIANKMKFKNVQVIPDLNNLPRVLKIEL